MLSIQFALHALHLFGSATEQFICSTAAAPFVVKHCLSLPCCFSGFCNVDLLTAGGVDFTMSSLTKQFTGSGNVMGGTIVLNQHSSNYLRLRARMQRDYEELIFPEDAAVLLRSSLDLVGRSQRGNASTEVGAFEHQRHMTN